MNSDDQEYAAALLERVGRLLATEAHAEGLLPVQWEALRYLKRANRFSMTAVALSAYLGITKGTVSQTLNTLESKGLIKKRQDSQDRRSKRLSLTAKGRALLKRDPLLATAAALEALGCESRAQLSNTLGTFLAARLKGQDRQVFGQCHGCRFFAQQHPDGAPHYCQLLSEPLTPTDSDAICFEQVPA